MQSEDQELSSLEKNIDYKFKQHDLLVEALSHPSIFNQQSQNPKHYQRLEFLGDALLSLILAEKLYEALPDKREGTLSRHRSALAEGSYLANLARELKINDYIRMSTNEIRNGGRNRDSILEDVFEAIIGAIYLDSNWDTTRAIVLKWYGDIESQFNDITNNHNPKGQLQELVQPILGNDVISYEVEEELGPDHNKQFVVNVIVSGDKIGSGLGNSKKEAEEVAAQEALKKVKSEEISFKRT